MRHPKMGYTYVGVDSHKDTHTAVFLDCFFEKLGEIQFDNLPSKFPEFLNKALMFQQEGTTLQFGLEDASEYGRALAVFLTEKGKPVKHVNGLLVARERKNRNITEKTDSVDAECAARILLSKFGELPAADPQDKVWVLRTIVNRRDMIIRNNTALKNHLHTLLTGHYPEYRSYFEMIEGKTSLAFYLRYPSPSTLEGVTVDELADFLYEPSQGIFGAAKAKKILESLQETTVQFQEMRNEAVRSTVRQLQFNLTELERLEHNLATFLDQFDSTLTSMVGIDVVTATKMISIIGDIQKFSTPAKLARYAGIAPVTLASGKKDLQFANQRGNRELNSVIYHLAVRLSYACGSNNRVLNQFFYEYYNKKISDGKTKRQALKCVQRRLVNIIWTMMTNNEEYVNPPMMIVPKNSEA